MFRLRLALSLVEIFAENKRLPENRRSPQITTNHCRSSIERRKYYLNVVYVNNINL